jgi:hypothetical protein
VNRIKALAMNPFTYVVGFALVGALSIVAGIGLLFGTGWALVSIGAFLIAAASYITKGMKADG